MAKRRTQENTETADPAVESNDFTEEQLEKLEHVRELDATADSEELLGRFAAAGELCDVADESGYGDGAVPKLAETLEWSQEKVRQYVRVAEHYDQAAVEEMIEEAAEAGATFSWSHLVTLAGEGNKRSRDAGFNRVIKGNLSVRGLKKSLPGSKSNNGQTAPLTVKSALKMLNADAEVVIAHAKTFAKPLPKLLKGIADEERAKLQDDISTVRDRQQQARDACEQTVDLLDDLLEKMAAPAKKATAKKVAAARASDSKTKRRKSSKPKGKAVKKTTRTRGKKTKTSRKKS